jgi:hypothetical protein
MGKSGKLQKGVCVGIGMALFAVSAWTFVWALDRQEGLASECSSLHPDEPCDGEDSGWEPFEGEW